MRVIYKQTLIHHQGEERRSSPLSPFSFLVEERKEKKSSGQSQIAQVISWVKRVVSLPAVHRLDRMAVRWSDASQAWQRAFHYHFHRPNLATSPLRTTNCSTTTYPIADLSRQWDPFYLRDERDRVGVA